MRRSRRRKLGVLADSNDLPTRSERRGLRWADVKCGGLRRSLVLEGPIFDILAWLTGAQTPTHSGQVADRLQSKKWPDVEDGNSHLAAERQFANSHVTGSLAATDKLRRWLF